MSYKKKPESKPREMTVSSSTVAKSVLKQSWYGIKLGFAVAIIIYFIFAISIVRFVLGFSGGAGLVLSKNETFYGGVIPTVVDNKPQTELLVDLGGTHDGSILDNAKQAVMLNPNTAIVDVYYGPSGTLQWAKPDILAIDGKVVPGSLPQATETDRNPSGSPINEKERLDNEYVGVCIKGACEPGNVVIFKREQIMGVPVFESSESE